MLSCSYADSPCEAPDRKWPSSLPSRNQTPSHELFRPPPAGVGSSVFCRHFSAPNSSVLFVCCSSDPVAGWQTLPVGLTPFDPPYFLTKIEDRNGLPTAS